MSKKSLRSAGFTLLEILLVIAAIGILAAIVIVAINPTRQLNQVRDAQRRSDARSIIQALSQYSIDTNAFPSEVESLSNSSEQEICGRGVDEVTCISQNLLYLEDDLVPTYFSLIPQEPSSSGENGSGYVVYKDEQGRIGIRAEVSDVLGDPIFVGAELPETLLANWEYRLAFEIDASQISTDQSDFPVYFDLSLIPASHPFWVSVQNDGGDIAFGNSSGVRLPVEVVSIDTNLNIGEVYFQAPFISSSANSQFYLYYGNAAVEQPAEGDPYGVHNVWTNGFVGVYHLENGFSNSVADVADGVDVNTSDSVGRFGRGRTIGGGGNYISLGDNFSFERDDSFSLSAWVNRTVTGNNYYLLSKKEGTSDGDRGYYLRWENDNEIVFEIANSSGNRLRKGMQNQTSSNEWRHMALTYDGNLSYGGINLYSNAFQDVTFDSVNTLSTTTITPNAFNIGAVNDGDDSFQGLMDEIRISDVDRSTDWVSAEFVNQNTPNIFLTNIGSQENL